MAKFEGRYRSGRDVRRVVVEARDRATAERLVRRRGAILSLERKFELGIKTGMSVAERHTFMVRMSSMVGSRVGTTEALKLIAQNFGGRIRACAQSLLEKVEAGLDLPSAMENDPRNFPMATVALVKAGVASGETWRALRDAADFEYELQSLKKTAGRGVYTAMGSFLLAGALMLGTTFWLGPILMESQLVKGAGDAIDVNWVHVLSKASSAVMTVLLTAVGILAFLGTGGRRIVPVAADRIILSIPYYKDLVLARNNYVTLYKLALLMRAGVGVGNAIQLTHDAAAPGALKADLGRASKAVKEGRPWALAMTTLHPTDKAALSQSQDREDVARSLNLIATQYRDLYISRMSTFAPTLQVIAALFLTIAGGVLFGETILPILQLSAKYAQ